MTTVFLSGSMKIKHLDRRFLDRISGLLSDEFKIVVGDADGSDTAIQDFLFNKGARNVTVYCSGSVPRNNVGGWMTKSVSPSAVPGTRAYYTAKDVEMASIADFGLMMWDSKSTGTLSNVFEMLKRGKKSVVFVNKSKEFVTVKDKRTAHDLVNRMADASKLKADQKIGISTQLLALSSEQFALPL